MSTNVYFQFFGENKRVENKNELMIYYCAYELVNNSYKHSGAKNIAVQLVQDDNRISLTVQDDGCGFDVDSVTHGSGLKNVHNRVTVLNGILDMTSSPENGTETIIELRVES